MRFSRVLDQWSVEKRILVENSYSQIYTQRTVPTVPFSDLAAPAEDISR